MDSEHNNNNGPSGRLYYLQEYLKTTLLAKIHTGDALYDTIIAFILLSSQEIIRTYIGLLKDFLIASPKHLYKFIRIFIKWYKITYTNTPLETQIKKEAKISHITESREINTLFEPVMWYILSLTDTKKEETILLETTKNNSFVTQKLPKNCTSTIKFLDHDIEYSIATEMITIYAEREYKRENIIIALTTITSQERSADIIQQFAEMCQTKYSEFNSKKQWKQKIHRNEGKTWKSQESKTSRKLDTVILKEGEMSDLTADINEFIHREQWYVTRDVPYTRRYMFWGVPGTGKSSCIKALACHTKRHIHYLVLSSVQSDAELFSLFEQINFAETILVIEDIDCASDITHERKMLDIKNETPADSSEEPAEDSQAEKNKLTLSGLLNAIDGGIVENHGQIMVITTNHPEKLDEALVRPGRVDRRYEFSVCDMFQLEGLFFNFFERYPNDKCRGINIPNVSPADITGILLQHKKDPDYAWKKVLEHIS